MLPGYPEQITAPLAVTVSVFTTETVVVATPEHEPSVPVTVYTVVAVGLAMTVVPVVALSPVPGDHV